RTTANKAWKRSSSKSRETHDELAQFTDRLPQRAPRHAPRQTHHSLHGHHPRHRLSLLFWGIGKVMSSVMGQAAAETAPIMVQGGTNSPKVLAALSKVPGIQV